MPRACGATGRRRRTSPGSRRPRRGRVVRDLRRPAKGVKMQRALSVGLVASLLLTACGGAPTPAAPSAASAAPAPVKVGASYSNVIASNLPIWVAKEAGIFAKHGLDVELTLIESSQGIPALLTGDVKFAHIGGSEVVSAAAGGADLVIVGGTVPVWPYVLIVAPDVQNQHDLTDHKLALDVLKTYLKVTDTNAPNATYDHYVGTVIPSAPYVRADQFGDVIQTLGRTNEKVRTFDVSKILDESFVKSAIDRGVDTR